MDRSVALDRLPDGLAFPPELADRISYDPQNRRLVYSGFMSKAEFDRLLALSDDWSYRRRLEELFRACVPDTRPRGALSRAFSRLFGDGAPTR